MIKANAATWMMAGTLALGLAAAPAQAQAAAAAAKEQSADTQSAARPAEVRTGAATKYCVIEEGTGSRIGKRVCRTKADWKARGVDISTD